MTAQRDWFSVRPLLIGVVHCAPLPGAPSWQPGASLDALVDTAVRDATVLAEAGFTAVMVENFGDAPFFKDRVPPETIAALTCVARAVRLAVPDSVAVGVNVLRNDAPAAMAIAAAAGLQCIRVNVLAGAAVTDQGVIEGQAARLLRDRARLAPHVRILADVRVKHAAPLAPRPLRDEVHDLLGRGGADAVLVTGSGTGNAADLSELREVTDAAGDTPVLVASGVTPDSIGALLEHAAGAIVGTSLKTGGVTTNPVDPARAAALTAAT